MDEQPTGMASALVRTAFLVHAVYTEASRQHGLPVQQAQLVCVLAARPRGMGELSSMLGLEKSSLTGLVDRAARSGLVRREPDPLDRRAVLVALTAEGRATAGEFYPDITVRMEALADGMGAAERERLTALLERVLLGNEVPAVFVEPKPL